MNTLRFSIGSNFWFLRIDYQTMDIKKVQISKIRELKIV